MKKIFKMAAVAMTAAIITITMTISALAGTWKIDAKGWWWDNGNGTWPASTWQWCDGNGDGIAECYYFDGNGYCLLNTTTPDGYPVNKDGAWVNAKGEVQTQTAGTQTAQTVADTGNHPTGQQIVDYLNQFRSGTNAYYNGCRANNYFQIDSSKPAWNNGVTNVKWIGHVEPVPNLPNYSIDGYGGWIWWEYANGRYCPIAINNEHYIIADTIAPDGLAVNKYGICSVNGKPVSHHKGCQLVFQSVRVRQCGPGIDYSKVNSYADGGFSEISQAFTTGADYYKGRFIDYGTLTVNHRRAWIDNIEIHGGFYDCCEQEKLPY